MSYIPKEHLKYDILPNSRKGNWEVISYDSNLMNELLNANVDISPYDPKTMEDFYDEIDECIQKYPKQKELLLKFKEDLINRNNKLNWGIIKYLGKTNGEFTHNRCYYVPMFKRNNEVIVDGIIDDEEFTSYLVSGLNGNYYNLDFEIVEDPFNNLKNIIKKEK